MYLKERTSKPLTSYMIQEQEDHTTLMNRLARNIQQG